MRLVPKLIPSLIGGVSQQPPSLRLENQCELMENALPSIVHGLEKRPGTEVITSIESNADGSVAGHIINRDTDERYICLFTGDATEPIEVYTLEGIKCTIRYGDEDGDVVHYEPSGYSDGHTVKIDPATGDLCVILTNSSGADYDINKIEWHIVNVSPDIVPFKYRVCVQGMSTGKPSGTGFGTLNGYGQVFEEEFSHWGRALQRQATFDDQTLANGASIAIVFDLDDSVVSGGYMRLRTSVDGETIYDRTYTYESDEGDVSPTYWDTSARSYSPSVRLMNEGHIENTDYKDYFITANAKENIKAVSVADYTVATNKERTPAKSGSSSNSWQNEALLYVKQAVNGVGYSVKLDGGTEAYYDSTDSSPSTEDIRDNLLTNAGTTGLSDIYTSGWTFTAVGGNIIHIKKTTEAAFDIEAWDGWGDQALVLIKRTVEKQSDLPPQAPDGFIVEITGSGDSTNKFTNYFVQFENNDDANSGVWKEVPEPGLDNSFDDTTMPHRMVRTATNTFTVSPCEWEDRAVGDDDSNGDPSFIGYPITDVFFFKNRLGFLAGENIVLSRTSDFFNFWRGTALELLDDDPIDQPVSSNKVAKLQYAVPFQKDLLLFSDQEQFVLSSGDGILTPKTVSIDSTTRFETAQNCTPTGIGPNVYFSVPKDNYTAIREYFVQPDTVVDDASDVTAHVPNYIPSDSNLMAGSGAHDILLVGKTESEYVYVYKFMWNGSEKVQSSWSKWVLLCNVLFFGIIENNVYFVTSDGNTINIEKINLEKTTSGDLDFRVHLDRQQTVVGESSYHPTVTYTKWVVDYDSDNDNVDDWVLIDAATGEIYDIAEVNDYDVDATGWGLAPEGKTNILYEGDLVGTECVVGMKFTMRFRFSEVGIKAGDSGVSRMDGIFKLKTMSLNLKDTGYFKVEYTPSGRDKQTHTFEDTALPSKDHRVFVRGNAKDRLDLVNDSYLPSAFQAALFEGKYFTRSR